MAEHQRAVVPFFAQHCAECHGAKEPEGDLDLAKLDPDMKGPEAARWAMVYEQLASDKMPPKKVKTRPTAEQAMAVMDWIKAEMKRNGKHLARREAYANGNLVPHELLFDPKNAAPIEVASRLRRLSPEIYAGFIGEVGKNTNVGNPFSPEGKNTFKDMGEPKIDEPVTALLIRNALAIVERQTQFKIENGQVKGVGFTPKEFLALFDDKNPATDAQLEAAIKMQFDRVIKRQPSKEESQRFVALLKKNMAEAGREVGVRYSLAAVYLLPEVVYRMEVGAGSPDALGRLRLAPREIAFALAYALTDKRPDAWLLDAAAKGKREASAGSRLRTSLSPSSDGNESRARRHTFLSLRTRRRKVTDSCAEGWPSRATYCSACAS